MTSPTTRRSWPQRSQLLLAICLLTLGGCVDGEPDDGATASILRSDAVPEDIAYSMALATIDDLADQNPGDRGIAAVVVPSDNALLALDADRLAELAGDGGLDSLLIEVLVSDDVDLSSLSAIDGAEEFVFSSTGTAHLLRATPPTPTFADQPIRTIDRRGPLTVIVVDGIVEP